MNKHFIRVLFLVNPVVYIFNRLRRRQKEVEEKAKPFAADSTAEAKEARQRRSALRRSI